MIGLILCAGHGTRLKEETKDKPKCMVEVGGKPVLEHIANHMNKHGIWRIIVNLHSFPEVVMKHFGQRFLYLYEPVPMGEFATTKLVEAVFPDDDLVVMNGDTLTDIDLSELIHVGANGRCISKKTGVHVGTTMNPRAISDGDLIVDCEYFDIGTPEGLAKARKHYGV